MEGFQWGGGGEEGRMGEKVQGIRRIIGRHKLGRGRLRIVQEMEKPENLYVQLMDMNEREGMLVRWGWCRAEEDKG